MNKTRNNCLEYYFWFRSRLHDARGRRENRRHVEQIQRQPVPYTTDQVAGSGRHVHRHYRAVDVVTRHRTLTVGVGGLLLYRTVYLDNVATPWMLAAFVFVAERAPGPAPIRRDQGNDTVSGEQ